MSMAAFGPSFDVHTGGERPDLPAPRGRDRPVRGGDRVSRSSRRGCTARTCGWAARRWPSRPATSPVSASCSRRACRPARCATRCSRSTTARRSTGRTTRCRPRPRRSSGSMPCSTRWPRTPRPATTTRRCPRVLDAMRAGFEAGLADDLNVSASLGALFDGVRELNRRIDARSLSTADATRAAEAIRALDVVLGVTAPAEEGLEPDLQALIDERAAARAVARLGGLGPAAGRAPGPRRRGRGHARRPALAARGDGRWLTTIARATTTRDLRGRAATPAARVAGVPARLLAAARAGRRTGARGRRRIGAPARRPIAVRASGSAARTATTTGPVAAAIVAAATRVAAIGGGYRAARADLARAARVPAARTRVGDRAAHRPAPVPGTTSRAPARPIAIADEAARAATAAGSASTARAAMDGPGRAPADRRGPVARRGRGRATPATPAIAARGTGAGRTSSAHRVAAPWTAGRRRATTTGRDQRPSHEQERPFDDAVRDVAQPFVRAGTRPGGRIRPPATQRTSRLPRPPARRPARPGLRAAGSRLRPAGATTAAAVARGHRARRGRGARRRPPARRGSVRRPSRGPPPARRAAAPDGAREARPPRDEPAHPRRRGRGRVADRDRRLRRPPGDRARGRAAPLGRAR